MILCSTNYRFSRLKQNKLPIFLVLCHYLKLRYKIEESAHLHILEKEKVKKKL